MRAANDELGEANCAVCVPPTQAASRACSLANSVQDADDLVQLGSDRGEAFVAARASLRPEAQPLELDVRHPAQCVGSMSPGARGPADPVVRAPKSSVKMLRIPPRNQHADGLSVQERGWRSCLSNMREGSSALVLVERSLHTRRPLRSSARRIGKPITSRAWRVGRDSLPGHCLATARERVPHDLFPMKFSVAYADGERERHDP